MKLIKGNCIEVLKTLEENSVDSVVTDPPYEIGFMGKSWDSSGIANNPEMWKECLRVLKPGGYLLSFSATRTYHRMAVGIEDAGFEIRDMIEWVYGSGFPKSHNIGKAVDKLGGRGLGQEIGNIIKQRRIELGYSTIKLAEIGGFYGNTNHGGTVSNWETGNGSITPEQFNKLIDILGLENEPVIANERRLLGRSKFGASSIYGSEIYNNRENGKEIDITKGTSEWEGWGTALKPAHEPICMARKPLAEKTVAKNCLKYGTGGINIDESRITTNENLNGGTYSKGEKVKDRFFSGLNNHSGKEFIQPQGRFPANLIHDNSEEVKDCFPETHAAGNKKPVEARDYNATSYKFGTHKHNRSISGDNGGNASRFFKSIIYQSKPSKKERNAGCDGLETKQYSYDGRDKEIENAFQRNKSVATNNHPTVKPIALMEYLINMVTPKGGVVLDPFMGSGTTGCASVKNGFDFIGIDLEDEYIKIATARINHYKIF